MNDSERFFRQLLEERGLVHGQDFWHDEEMFSQLSRLGTVPDFYLKRGSEQLLIEVKELQGNGVRRSGRGVQTPSARQLQAALVEPLKRAKNQLAPYVHKYGLPTLVVFFDTNGTHLLERATMELVFGEPNFWIFHDPNTGQGSDPAFHLGGRDLLNNRKGAHVSALGVIGCEQWDAFRAWQAQDASLAKLRVRILRNPHAKFPAPLTFFNAQTDQVYE